MKSLIAVAGLLLLGSVVPSPHGVAAAQSFPTPTAQAVRSSSGPVAISMSRGGAAVILQGDGSVVSFDTSNASVGQRVFRLARKFFAADVATLPYENGNILVLTVNSRSAKENESWVLQVLPDSQEIWTWMRQRGVYVGVASDPTTGYVYATNSTNNAIYRIASGRKDASAIDVARVDEAERIGPLAVDGAGRRLFVADMGRGTVYIVPFDKGGRRGRIEVPDAEEIRALAWSAETRRLYVADSGQEVVWSIDPDRRQPPKAIRDKRFREPAGLTVAQDALWLVDAGANAAFRITETSHAVGRAVTWDSKK